MRNLILVTTFFILNSCCKDDSSTIKSTCFAYKSQYTFNSTKSEYNYIYQDSNLKAVYSTNINRTYEYSHNRIEITSNDNNTSNYDKTVYTKFNEDSIVIEFSSNTSALISKLTLYLKDGLIVKDNASSGINYYFYNSDNTLKNKSKNNVQEIQYEYYDKLSQISFLDDMYIVTKYFNLKRVFKLEKQNINLQVGQYDTLNFTYEFDSTKNTIKQITTGKNVDANEIFYFRCYL